MFVTGQREVEHLCQRLRMKWVKKADAPNHASHPTGECCSLSSLPCSWNGRLLANMCHADALGKGVHPIEGNCSESLVKGNILHVCLFAGEMDVHSTLVTVCCPVSGRLHPCPFLYLCNCQAQQQHACRAGDQRLHSIR